MNEAETDSGIEYAPNILRNPRHFFGTWTPEGWRTHRISQAKTAAERVVFSGDGKRSEFAGLPDDVAEGVHDASDEASDGGIYPSVPRVEYPPGRPRWAVSHTFLAYPVADQTLYEQEYVWEAEKLHTHFRRHVLLEESVTGPGDGLSCFTQNRRLSTVIAGNKVYPLCNSAVRGVWDNPEKTGRNYYSRRIVKRCASHNAVYVVVKEQPVLQCHGIWKHLAGDEAAFAADGSFRDEALLVKNGIPLDCPKLGLTGYGLKRVPSDFYGGTVEVVDGKNVTIDERMLAALQSCRDVPCQPDGVGFAAWKHWDHAEHINGVPGHYAFAWDLNENGVVDAEDEEALRRNIGRKVRVNYYSAAYFGNDWLSTGILLNPEMQGGEPLVCAWDQGAGYEAESGEVRLFETPGPGKKVYVEYHYDEPATTGRDNIAVVVRRATAS